MVVLESYFNVVKESGKYDVDIHRPVGDINTDPGEHDVYHHDRKIGTISWNEVKLDVSELRVERITNYNFDKDPTRRPTAIEDKKHISISPGINQVKRYQQLILTNKEAKKLAKDILECLK